TMAFTLSAPARARASVAAIPIDRINPPSESRPAPGAPPQVNLAALIDGLQSKYARMQGLAADFTQVYFGADGRTTSESGHLILKRPGKARWEYTQPVSKLLISDGRQIIFYVYGERQATVAAVKE